MVYNSIMLNTKDYELMAALIDAATRRGLLGATDLVTVGQLHQKLMAVIQTEKTQENQDQSDPQ